MIWILLCVVFVVFVFLLVFAQKKLFENADRMGW
jgi:hypothetical protein